MQVISTVLLLIFIALFCTSALAADDVKTCAKPTFDVTLPESASFENFKVKQAPMLLASAGMRKKSLVVMSVNVYKVGIYLSEQKDKDVAASVATGAGFNLAAPLKDDSMSVGIVLEFVRDVAASSVVDVIL